MIYSETENKGKAGGAFREMCKRVRKTGQAEVIASLQAALVAAGIKDKRKKMEFSAAAASRLHNSLQKNCAVYYLSGIKLKLLLPTSVLNAFFDGLPAGWKLFIEDKYHLITLTVPVPPFELEDKGLKVKFSNLIINLNLPGLEVNIGLLITVSPGPSLQVKSGRRSHSGKIHRCHPHNGSQFCLGESGNLLHTRLKSWDIVSAYNLFYSLVTNYRRNSAYEPLDVFTRKQGIRCAGCGVWILKTQMKKETVSCFKCHKLFCPECQKTQFLEEGKEPNSPANTCYICKKEKVTSLKGKSCRDCREKRTTLKKCNYCGKTVCTNNTPKFHSFRCPDCGQYACKKCAKRCPRCGAHACKKHKAKNKKGSKWVDSKSFSCHYTSPSQ